MFAEFPAVFFIIIDARRLSHSIDQLLSRCFFHSRYI